MSPGISLAARGVALAPRELTPTSPCFRRLASRRLTLPSASGSIPLPGAPPAWGNSFGGPPSCRLSDRVQVQWLESTTVGEAGGGDLAVSRSGTLAAAMVTPPRGRPPGGHVHVRSLGEASQHDGQRLDLR